MAPTHRIAKVRVYQNGRVTLDEKEVTLEELRKEFGRLRAEQGTVWYYREGEPMPPIARSVLAAVAAERVPISLSSKPDYSDAVLLDGSTVPR